MVWKNSNPIHNGPSQSKTSIAPSFQTKITFPCINILMLPCTWCWFSCGLKTFQSTSQLPITNRKLPLSPPFKYKTTYLCINILTFPCTWCCFSCLIAHYLALIMHLYDSLQGPNQSNSSAPEGCWSCSKCGNLNYPFRTVCNRKDCGNERPNTGN